VKRLILSLLGLVLGFAATTLVALEGKDVVVVRTRDENGAWRETRTWIAEEDGVAYIEIANPERAFYKDIQRNAEVEVKRGDRTETHRAVVMKQPDGHQLIRRLLRQRYGWADIWIGLIADTSESLGLRLEPVA
jgi:hypothetical protein